MERRCGPQEYAIRENLTRRDPDRESAAPAHQEGKQHGSQVHRLLPGRPRRQISLWRREPAFPEDFLSKLAVEVRPDQRLEGEGGLVIFIGATLRSLLREISFRNDITE